jgi:hypothetical protein
LRMRKVRGLFSVLILTMFGSVISDCSGTGSSSASKGFTVSVWPSTVTVSAGYSGVPAGNYTVEVEGQDTSNPSIANSTALTRTVD